MRPARPASEQTIALLGELVGFNTVSSRSNLALIEHVAARLRAQDIRVEVLPSPDRKKANLWATIGPRIDGGIVLSGHSDTVPVDGQNWSGDPFAMWRKDGRLYGRGTADMKGFIACAIAAMERHRLAPLRRPLHLALSYDEEIGCLGAPELLAWLAGQSPRPSVALIGEPTGMQMADSHKGVLIASTEITGVEAHSSLAHLGVSAVDLAGRAIVLLQDVQREFSCRHRHPRFEPDYTTISVNRIQGGTAANILAGRARFDWDTRCIPGTTGQDILERFGSRLEQEVLAPTRQLHPGVDGATAVIANVPPLMPESDGEAARVVTALLGPQEPSTVAFGTEAGQFQAAGISSLVIGPGSIEQAHRADEYVEIDQLGRCETFLDELVGLLCSS